MPNKKDWPIKYARDGGDRITAGDIAKGLGELLDRNASSDELCDYIDREFLWGAWGYLSEKLMTEPKLAGSGGRLFLKDIRGLLIAAYKAGKGTLDDQA